jgi:hypothetical protein
MVEKSSTRAARRAVAKLIARYFKSLKRELADQTGGFWTRVETAIAAKAQDEKIEKNR